jgi:hypothetical protein
MKEVVAEKLSERERTGLKHLQQAQVLGISLAEYCRKFELDLGLWYRVKQKLVRKGLSEKGETGKVAKIAMSGNAVAKRRTTFAPVQIVEATTRASRDAPPVVTGTPMACRIVHPSGWIVECGTLPQASWLATVMAGPRP